MAKFNDKRIRHYFTDSELQLMSVIWLVLWVRGIENSLLHSQVFNMQFLLLFERIESRDGGMLSGKIFGHMVSGTHVICVGISKDKCLEGVFLNTGIGLFSGKDESTIQSALTSLLVGEDHKWFNPNVVKIRKFLMIHNPSL